MNKRVCFFSRLGGVNAAAEIADIGWEPLNAEKIAEVHLGAAH